LWFNLDFMAQIDRQFRRCQMLLLEYFGLVPGSSQPAVRWVRLPELYTIAPKEDADGNPEYDYRCKCGLNRYTHEPDCLITKPMLRVARFEFPVLVRTGQGENMQVLNLREFSDPSNIYVLSRWVPPPSPVEWIRIDGDLESYPANGTYYPITVNYSGVWVRGVPEELTTRAVIEAFKAYHSKTKAQHLEESQQAVDAKDWVPPKDERGRYVMSEKGPPGNRFHMIHDMVKQGLTLNAQSPGKKGSVVYPTPGFMQARSQAPSPKAPSPTSKIILTGTGIGTGD
jgi:hypothetical protein